MGYRALLFCPDEKIARTVTQVLSELEFAVEACVEPFAAVKKLMAEHFDAVVVDCDNDQNASLLFKSARSSAINQASLAVAVVEGQPGVAKAFRIGANLVLTKPINVEQAKGTLRVARGLLRKGEAAKPSAPIPTTPVPPKPAGIVPAAPARPATLSAATAAKPRLAAPPIAKPAASVPAKPQVQTTVSAAASSSGTTANAAIESAVNSALPANSSITPSILNSTLSNAGSPASSAGAASAPASAREAAAPVVAAAPGGSKTASSAEKIAETSPAHTSPADSKPVESTTAPAPTFTFGGANLPETSASGGNKKIFLAIAAAALLVCVAYFGWTQLHDKLSAPAAGSNQTSPATGKVPAPTQSAPLQPASASATSASSSGSQT
ncbi:MAG: hypothetical protein WBQ08_06625, partial [Candidatus Sulfotelmatobacter sp.]